MLGRAKMIAGMSCAPYTGADGASCHQCKSRRRCSDLYYCTYMPSKTRTCRKKFCRLCLDKFYDDAAPLPGQDHLWKCPSCNGICTCASCQRTIDPTGIRRRISRDPFDYDMDAAPNTIIGAGGMGSMFAHDARQLLMSLTSLPGVRARIDQFVALQGVDDQSKIEAIASLLNQGAFPGASSQYGDGSSQSLMGTFPVSGTLTDQDLFRDQFAAAAANAAVKSEANEDDMDSDDHDDDEEDDVSRADSHAEEPVAVGGLDNY